MARVWGGALLLLASWLVECVSANPRRARPIYRTAKIGALGDKERDRRH